MVGETALLMAEEYDQKGHQWRAEAMETVAFVGMTFTVMKVLLIVYRAGSTKGYRAASRISEQMTNRNYLAAWREAQKHYSYHFAASAPAPDHVEEGWLAERQAEEPAEVLLDAEEADAPAGDG
jgi:hypothetical protein